MSFEPVKSPFSPLKKTFEAFTKTPALPSVLPNNVQALQAILVAQQDAHAALVVSLHQEAQAIRQEAHD